jgi:hypothetical protein
MGKTSNQEIQRLLMNGFCQFRKCISNYDLDKLDKNDRETIDHITEDWEGLCTRDWSRYIERIENVQELFDFKNELSVNLVYPELIQRVGQCFAEIDCAKQLIVEFVHSRIVKLKRQKKGKTCDFRVDTEPPHFVEIKTITTFAERTLYECAVRALGQIRESVQNESFKGVVWVFTYDTYNLEGAEALVKKVKASIQQSTQFTFSLTVQVYNVGLYGDSAYNYFK